MNSSLILFTWVQYVTSIFINDGRGVNTINDLHT